MTFNSESSILPLLESLPQALAGLSAEVVVVDNGSVDGTVRLLSQRTDATVIVSENHGYAAGINLGASFLSHCDSYLVLNPDVVLSPHSISVLSEALTDPRVGIVAPRVLDANGLLTRSLRREPRVLRSIGLGITGLPCFAENLANPASYEVPQFVDWAVGAVLLIRATCYRSIEGWDPSFFLYSEETDFCLRARDAGWRMKYEPSAVAVHSAGGSGRSGRTQAMQILNQVRFYRRRHRKVESWAFYSITVLAQLSRVLRRHSYAREPFIALIRKSRRPPELGLANRLLPSDDRK